MTKTSLTIVAALFLSGCSPVDNAINEAINGKLSGDVTTETIKAKDLVTVINKVSYTGCTQLKQSIELDSTYKNVEILVTDIGVTCGTYGKTSGIPEEQGTRCTEEDLSEWLSRVSYPAEPEFDSVSGKQACIVGADL